MQNHASFNISNAPTLSEMQRALAANTKPPIDSCKYACGFDPAEIDPLQDKPVVFSVDVHDIREHYWEFAWWVWVGSDVTLYHFSGKKEAAGTLFIEGPNSKSAPPPCAHHNFGRAWHVCTHDGARRILWKDRSGRSKDSFSWAKRWVEEHGDIACPLQCSLGSCPHCCTGSKQWQSLSRWLSRVILNSDGEDIDGVELERAAAFMTFSEPSFFWKYIAHATVRCQDYGFSRLIPHLHNMFCIRGINAGDFSLLFNHLFCAPLRPELYIKYQEDWDSFRHSIVRNVKALAGCLEHEIFADKLAKVDLAMWSRWKRWSSAPVEGFLKLGLLGVFMGIFGRKDWGLLVNGRCNSGDFYNLMGVLEALDYYVLRYKAVQSMRDVVHKFHDFDTKQTRTKLKKTRRKLAREENELTSEYAAGVVAAEIVCSSINRVIHDISEEEQNRPKREAAARRARIAAEERARRQANSSTSCTLTHASVDHCAPNLFPQFVMQPKTVAVVEKKQWVEASPERAEERARNKEKKEAAEQSAKTARAKALAKAKAMNYRESAMITREFMAPTDSERSEKHALDIMEAAEVAAAKRATSAASK